jgi:hypothetical protein
VAVFSRPIVLAKERDIASGRVAAASGIVKERLNTGGRVEMAGDVASERQETNSSVEPRRWLG